MSEHIWENAENFISDNLSSKRGMTPIKIDANWKYQNLVWSS